MSHSNVWIGSWRPHKARGPIAAHYKSPGPKYVLPVLTGSTNHSPTKHKAPSHSFGRYHCPISYDCSPGPKYLLPSNITKAGKVCTPSFSISSRLEALKPFQVPGPDTYYPGQANKVVFQSSPAYSLSGRINLLHNNQTPGPAGYLLPPLLGPKVITKVAAPSYSLQGRSNFGSFTGSQMKTPGPGTYKVVDPCIYKYKAPAYSVTGCHTITGSSCVPGPGAHYAEQVTCTRIKAPSFSFGMRHSEYLAPLTLESAE